MMHNQIYDADARPPLWPRGPLPAGSYPAEIVSAYLDHYSEHLVLALTWMVIDGPWLARRVYDPAVLSGDESLVRQAQEKIKAIAAATGYPGPHPAQCSELYDRPCLITVKVTEAEGGPFNEVVGYAQLQSPSPFAGDFAARQ